MQNNRGGITVFFSLALLLIMALLGTMVEVTRGKICQIHGRRTLKTAAERLLTEYSRPLYDRYGLFFLEDTGESFEQCIARYAGDTLNPEGIVPRITDLYDGAVASVEVQGKHYTGDDGGAILLRQIEAKMKRQLASDIIEAGRNRQRPALSVEESAQTIDEKVEKEREEAETGLCLLELMEKIDGVSCTKGKLKGKKYFAKMFYRGTNRAENLGITEPVVWNAIKDNMVNLDDTFSKLTDPAEKTRFLEQVKKAKEKTEQALTIMRNMGTKLASLELGDEPVAILAGNKRILEQTEQMLVEDVTPEAAEELEQLWKNYDTSGVRFRYTGVSEEGGGENPMEVFSETLSDGIMNLVLKDGETVSDKTIRNADGYCRLYENAATETDYESRVQSFTTKQEVELQGALGGITDISASDYFLCEYVKKYFSRWGHPREDGEHCLAYELEYLIGGGSSDRKNLEQIVNRLFLIRTAVNTTTLLASSSRRETAYAAALSVVGFTGVEPLIRFTQTLFLVVWGMAEALVDVAGILQGKQVALIKTEADLLVEFPDLFQFNHAYVMNQAGRLSEAGSHSFGYEEYLVLFLLGNKRETTCFRMMDIMQQNIRENEVEHFNIGMCVDSFAVNGTFTFPTKCFRFPYIRNILQRELYEFHTDATIQMAYVES